MNLRLDWATFEAARYACLNWHYSKCMPSGKLVKVGVWEDEKYIGCVIYGLGATPNLSKPYGLKMTECCELVRIALTKHKTAVSRILSISFKFLKKKCPGLKLIVSFADGNQGHNGGIYQATNWIYTGTSSGDIFYEKDGKVHHGRSIVARYGSRSIQTAKERGYKIVRPLGKHRYLMPLDENTAKRIITLKKKYPKRAESKDSVAFSDQEKEDGVNPISALHHKIGGISGHG